MAVSTDKIVLNSALLTLGSTVSASALPKKYGGNGSLPHPNLLIGTGLTFLGLSILGDFAPEVAGPLAGAIAITALTYYGIPVLDNYFNDTKVSDQSKRDTVPDPTIAARFGPGANGEIRPT